MCLTVPRVDFCLHLAVLLREEHFGLRAQYWSYIALNTTWYPWWEHAAYPAELLLEGYFNHETAQCWGYNSRQEISDENMMHIKSPFDWRDVLPSSTFRLRRFLVSSPRIPGFTCFLLQWPFCLLSSTFSVKCPHQKENMIHQKTNVHERTGFNKNDIIIIGQKNLICPPVAALATSSKQPLLL